MQSVFGLHLEEERTITIEGSPRYSAAPIYYGHGVGEEFKWTEVEADGSTWELILDPGDYVVRLEDDDAQGPITITPSDPVALITIPLTGTPVAVAGTLEKQASVVTGDPKDPWPPPQEVVEIPTESMDWFETYLSPHYGVSRGEGDAPAGRPASEDASSPAA